MVDEDPQQAPDAFMATLQTSSNTRFLKVLMDRSSGRRLIVIRPNLEKWVISVTREIERTEAVEGLLQTYYLPATFRDLHDALNIQGRPNQHFIRMISELKARSSVLQSLADMLGIT